MNIANCLLTGANDNHIHYINGHIGLHTEIITPWLKLKTAAQLAGFEIEVASGFRSFERQLSIWNRKFSGELPVKNISNQLVDMHSLNIDLQVGAVMTFSALPATSRHHWGTDLDFYSPSALNSGQKLQLEPWEYQDNGPFATLALWLHHHAQEFGFYFPYDQYRGGVAAEPWHLSYFPIAQQIQQALTPDIVYTQLKHCDIAAKSYILDHLPELIAQYVQNVGNVPNG